MFNVSAAMAGEFVRLANQMVEQTVALGPNPLRSSPQPQPELTPPPEPA
jgi:hypothetical protein